MKKFILAAVSVFALSAFVACSADTLAVNIDSTDTEGVTGVVSNKKADATTTRKKSSSSKAKSSSSSYAKSSSSSAK